MKKIILAWAIFLAPASLVLGQEAAPADTGAVATPPQQNVPADTGAVAPQSSDTGTVAPQQPDTPGDTGSVTAPPQEAIPADTGGAVAPPQQNIPADSAAAAPPPADSGAVPPQPADTGRALPQEKISPVDTTAAPPLPEKAPTDTAVILSPEEEEAPKERTANRVAFGIVFNDEAPVSMRAWFNPKVGLDIGLGLRGRRVDDSSTISDSTPTPQTRVMLLDLSFDLGIPIRAIRKEKVDFVFRPGFGVRTRPNFEVSPTDTTVRSIETTIELEMNGSVGFEYYPFEKAGFSLHAGLALILVRTGGDISNSILQLQSLPSKKGVNFAFRYYVF